MLEKFTDYTTHNALERTTFHHAFYSLLFDGLYLHGSQHSGNYNVFSKALLITNEEQGDLVEFSVAQQYLVTGGRW